jgi:hypothetical protein
MTTDLQIVAQTSMPNAVQPPIAVSAEKSGVAIGVNTAPIYVANNSFYGGLPTAQRVVDNTRCNIFVVKDETFSGGCFTIPMNRIHLNGVDMSETVNCPSLFLSTNGEYRRCKKTGQMFFYGFVKNLEPKTNGVKVSYEIRSTPPLLQQQLNGVALRLGINQNNGIDVLDHTGWLFYQLDIVKELTDAGFNMTVY